MCAKGNFSREDIVTVLTANQGNVEAAFQELNKVQLKPFLMRIWGQGEVGEVTSGQVPEEHQGTHLLSFVINNNTYVRTYVRSARLFQRRKSTIPTYTR